MGADGGSIPDRRDLVRTKAKGQLTDKALLRELFFLCALSKRTLTRPVVLDPLGKLYNKDAVIEFFLDKSKYGDGDQICGYLKGVKDLLTLHLMSNPEYTPPTSSTTSNIPSKAPFVCPLSFKEMSGAVPFIALRPCGCVFSDAAIRGIIPTLTKGLAAAQGATKAVSPPKKDEEDSTTTTTTTTGATVNCPNCGTSFDPTRSESITPINPPREVQELLLEHLLTMRATAKSNKKRKAPVTATIDVDVDTGIKGSNGIERDVVVANAPLKKIARTSHSASPAPVNSSVQRQLAEQEQKRLKAQEGMSAAVKSMFLPKDGNGDKNKKVGDAADFFGRTFTRYA